MKRWITALLRLLLLFFSLALADAYPVPESLSPLLDSEP